MSESSSNSELIKYIQSGDYDQFTSLYKQVNANESLCDENGCTLLHWAAINNRVKIIDYLLNQPHLGHNNFINTPAGTLNEIPLQWACRNDKFTYILHILITHKSDLNHKNIYGHTALHIACKCGNIHIAYLLLCNGADIDAVDIYGNTALYCLLLDKDESLSTENKRQIIHLLLNFNTNLLHLNNNNHTAMHIMSTLVRDFDPYLALLLVEKGCTIKPEPENQKSTHAKLGLGQRTRQPIVLYTRNTQGITAYDLAKQLRNLHMIHFLFDQYCYHILPSYFPVIIMTFTVIMSFLILHYFNVWYSICIIIVLYTISSKITQEYIAQARARLQLGWVYGTCVYVRAYMCIYVYIRVYSVYTLSLCVYTR